MVISKKNLEKYNKKMEEISRDIWKVVDNFEYYSMIRGIMKDYFNNIELSKRQTLRLYEFIFDLKHHIYSKDIINQCYINAKNELEAE